MIYIISNINKMVFDNVFLIFWFIFFKNVLMRVLKL